MSKYKKIQREKLSGKSLEIYDKLKKASKNFENTEGKIGEALDKFYNKVEKTAVEVEKKVEPKKATPKKSTAKKSTKKKTAKKKTASKKPLYKNVNQGSFAKLASKIMKERGISYREAQKEASKVFAEEKKVKREAKAAAFSKGLKGFRKKYKGKGLSGTTIEKDAELPAKPVGKRISKNNKVYYEYRDNRTDQKQPQPTDKPRLAKGGTIMSADIKEKIFDENGERKIDKKSIEILTEYVNSLEQTKSANQKDGKYTPSRKKLHGKIIEKFKDGVVCIDNNKPIAILMGGSPASGKSTFLKKYAPYLLKDEILRIDADEVRAMLPEYEGWNASQTHLETKDIVNTLLSDRTIGLPCETDIIYDGTMNSNKSYLPLIEVLRKLDYKIFVVYIDKVPKDVIVDRALNRYKSSGRFVPLEVIDDFFDKGKSALNEIKKKVDGYMIVDGSGGNYKVIEEGGIKLPKTRKYGKIGSPMKKKMEFGGDIAESYDVRPPYGTYAKGGKMKRDWSTYYHDGGMVEGYDVRYPYGTYAEGGTLPIGYHKMPDGEIMADSEHFAKGGAITKTGNKGAAKWEMKITDEDGNTSSIYADKKSDLLQYKKMYLAKGGYVCMNCGEYAKGGKVKTTKRKKRKR